MNTKYILTFEYKSFDTVPFGFEWRERTIKFKNKAAAQKKYLWAFTHQDLRKVKLNKVTTERINNSLKK